MKKLLNLVTWGFLIAAALAPAELLLIAQDASANYSPVYTGNLTNDSTAVLTTTNLQIAAPNAARKYLVIQNVGTNNIGCAPGITAVYQGAGTVTLVPNGSWSFEANFVPTTSINCIAATGTGNPVTAWEGQ